MLLDLSAELLEAIGAKVLSSSDHAVLRIVCKSLNDALFSLFFSVLVLKTNRNGLDMNRVEMLKAIAAGQTGWSQHAKTLHIIPAKPTVHNDTEGKQPVNLLVDTLASLSNIHTVLWKGHHQEFWKWGQPTILDFLNGLSTLDNLELTISGGVDLSTLAIRNLRRFTFKHYPLEALEVRLLMFHGTPLPPPMYHDVARLISQNRLTSLRLEGNSEWSTVWNVLRDKTQCTRPVEITTSIVVEKLFDYLTSYSGITKLTLLFPDGGNVNESNRLADIFFETVLPCLAESLVELSCPAAYESRFSFGTHNVNAISLLHKLTTLEMSINAGAVRRVEDDPREYVDIGGIRYPIAHIGVSVKVDQADIDHVVILLLETAATLPDLRSLVIVSAETEGNRGAWCGNGRIHHRGAVNSAIVNAVKSFRTDVPCSTIVCAGSNTYEPRPLGGAEPDGGSLGYGQTGSWSRR
ncbi:hypothetical protein C8R45DRAFT_1221691 [Mycena sanguinolenta]|nr:hypothetical protein C8R45DRAFT_1221691 [Mycena sanguinolenta]